MQVTNLNPDADIGASAWMVRIGDRDILLDAGAHPRREGRNSLPLFQAAPDADPAAIVVTHCHLDHVGALPVALMRYPQAKVMMTDGSYFLIERVLHNSVNVMMRQREEAGIKDFPLFTHEQVDDYAAVFDAVPWRTPTSWVTRVGSEPKSGGGFTVELFDSGHTLGSAGALVRGGGRTLFYTGDVCFHDQTICRAARFNDVQADTVIVETTRGAQATPRGFNRATEIQRLGAAVRRVLERGGCALIPSFALGRTQEMLASLALMFQQGELPRQPVYIGGLGRVFTEIYDLEAGRQHRRHPGLRLTRDLQLVVLSSDQVENASLAGRLLVLTSGMLAPNTAAHTAAQRIVGHRRNAVFFVGYTDPNSPGGRLRAAGRGGRWVVDPGQAPLEVHSEIEAFDLTAHAQRRATVQWLAKVNPKVAILGHGDGPAREWFREALAKVCRQTKVLTPGPGETADV